MGMQNYRADQARLDQSWKDLRGGINKAAEMYNLASNNDAIAELDEMGIQVPEGKDPRKFLAAVKAGKYPDLWQPPEDKQLGPQGRMKTNLNNLTNTPQANAQLAAAGLSPASNQFQEPQFGPASQNIPLSDYTQGINQQEQAAYQNYIQNLQSQQAQGINPYQNQFQPVGPLTRQPNMNRNIPSNPTSMPNQNSLFNAAQMQGYRPTPNMTGYQANQFNRGVN